MAPAFGVRAGDGGSLTGALRRRLGGRRLQKHRRALPSHTEQVRDLFLGPPFGAELVGLDAARITVAVEDGSAVVPRQPAHSPEDADRESGRGLVIINAVASAWGTEQLGGGGKRVWAQVSRPAAGTNHGPIVGAEE